MSAPAPAPPPHRVPLTPSSASPSARSSESPRRDVAGHGSGSGPRALPHIQDLVQIVERRVDGIRYASLDKMLATAGTALKQSRFFVDLGRIDNAYVEYLFGSQIVTDVLRTSKDAPALHDSSQRHKQHKDLIRLINADQQTFIGVRDTIKADNERNGTRPAAASASAVTQATATVQDRPIPQGPRPQVEHARPQSFQPHTSPNSSANDALAQRFAQLRTSGRPVDGRPQSVMSDYAVRRGAPSLHMDSASAQNGIEQSGMAPGESPTQEFPKAPSPTYTPIRSLQSPTAIAPPRSTRTSANPLDRRTSTSSNASSASLARGSLISRHSTKRSEDFDSGNAAQKRPRRKSINKPMETEIDAQKLFDYLQTYSILLIDVRGRDQYDEGHIFASTGICIEPTSLRLNMSAEELYEALVLSPQEEQEFFEHRDMFDLVVYYDQSSTTASRNAGRSKALVALQEALYEYNQDKPLRFPPIMLDGGLDSWVEMVGIHSLMVSNTANRPRSIQRKPELRAHASSRIETQKRRHREYNPLAPEEEAKWRERARSESIVLDQQPPRPQQQIPPETNDGGSSYDISDFSRRYPDVSLVEKTQYEAPPREQQHVPAYPVPPRPSSQPPAPPVPPHPQSAPPLPPVPSRPPPAIARPSYSGVSERSSSQPAAPQRPQKLATYIPPKLKRVPRVGLHNFGATCYMNSTIQCLSATIDLTAVFLDGAYKRDVQEKNWKGSKGLMPELYCVLLRNLWESSDVDTIRPTNFRVSFEIYCSESEMLTIVTPEILRSLEQRVGHRHTAGRQRVPRFLDGHTARGPERQLDAQSTAGSHTRGGSAERAHASIPGVAHGMGSIHPPRLLTIDGTFCRTAHLSAAVHDMSTHVDHI